MKSLSVCVFWPSWDWIDRPYVKSIFGSYSSDFSIRDSLKMRDLLISGWYQNNFGENFKLLRKLSDHLENNKTGFRIATSVEGVGTGARAHVVVHDDLIKANDAYSEAKAKRAIEFLRAMSSRAADPKDFAQIIIMQRLNENDPTHWALEQGNWESLILPGEYESNRKCKTSIGFSDPRNTEGELLWPDRNDSTVLAELKEALGSYGYAAQIQQRPAPIEGGIIKLNWWKFYNLIKNNKGKITEPHFEYIYQSWDTAFKVGQENDYSVCTTWGYANIGFCIIHRWKGKVDFPTLENLAISLANEYNPNEIGIEDAASGQSLCQSLKKRTNLPIRPIKIDRDKVARLHAVSPTIESGRVFLPLGEEWVPDLMEQMSLFPNGKHDDDVDSVTQALSRLILYRSRVKQIHGSLISR